ncbi:NAD-dependent epimerase/dehydratase family protein [Cupriavidus campinensis]
MTYPRTVLLTGASGYAGAAIAACLRAAGIRVLTAGRRPDDDIAFDLADAKHWDGLSVPPGVDVCIHAAAATERLCRDDAVAAHTINVTATRMLLRALERAGVGNVIYLSTFHVFGHPRGGIDEDTLPVPANDYGLTHLMAEQAVMLHARRTGARATVLRPANLFGTPARWERFDRWSLAPFDFARQAASTGRIRLLSDGSPVRAYVSLDDVCNAACAAINGQLPALTHLSGRAWSMAELARACAQVASETTGQAVPVELGRAGQPEQPFEFRSRHWAAEADASGKSMARFLRDVLAHVDVAGSVA